MKITRAGVDIAKSVFHVHAVDRHDETQWQAKLKRSQWLDALCERLAPGAEVGMEACASSHHWGRELHKRGFRVKLIAAHEKQTLRYLLQFGSEIRAIVHRYSKTLRDDEIAGILVSQAFRVNMRKSSLEEAHSHTVYSADAFRDVFRIPG